MSLLTIHNLLVGEASAAGLLSLARAENLKNSKGFMNHCIYMRQIFLRYWAVSTKGVTLLEWISSNGIGVDYVGWDVDNNKGPISLAKDRMVVQEKTFNKLLVHSLYRWHKALSTRPPSGITRPYTLNPVLAGTGSISPCS
jgi:hypothetical protein